MLRLIPKTFNHLRRHGFNSTLRRTAGWISRRRERPEWGQVLRSYLEGPFFDVDRYEINGDELSIHGTYVPLDGDLSRNTVALNGVPLESVQYPNQDKHFPRHYWYLSNAVGGSFVATARLGDMPPQDGDSYTVNLVDRQTGASIYPYRNYAIPKSLALFENVPDRQRVSRVAGIGVTSGGFVFHGYTAFKRIQQLVSEVAGKDLTSCRNVLDWGCGCGRLTRHFIRERLPGSRVVGADIDADNVLWSTRHLPGGEFVTLGLEPPSSLQTASFDLIAGYSVMTHLKESTQDRWLEELRRVSAPNAVVILTTHGKMAAVTHQMRLAWIKAWQQRGFDASLSDPILDGYIDDPDYYRGAFHTHEYIRQHWAKYFKIEAIIPYAIGYQDAVVMTRQP